jgi:hypothetical protein
LRLSLRTRIRRRKAMIPRMMQKRARTARRNTKETSMLGTIVVQEPRTSSTAETKDKTIAIDSTKTDIAAAIEILYADENDKQWVVHAYKQA